MAVQGTPRDQTQKPADVHDIDYAGIASAPTRFGTKNSNQISQDFPAESSWRLYMCPDPTCPISDVSRVSSGFTLTETLVATAILVSGLLAIANLFAFSIRTNKMTEQQTSATLLVSNKMEQLRGASFSTLTAGGGLDPSSLMPSYWDYVSITTSGAILSDTTTTGAPYLRLWQIAGAETKAVSVVVYPQKSGVGMQQMERARASTEITSGF